MLRFNTTVTGGFGLVKSSERGVVVVRQPLSLDEPLRIYDATQIVPALVLFLFSLVGVGAESLKWSQVKTSTAATPRASYQGMDSPRTPGQGCMTAVRRQTAVLAVSLMSAMGQLFNKL